MNQRKKFSCFNSKYNLFEVINNNEKLFKKKVVQGTHYLKFLLKLYQYPNGGQFIRTKKKRRKNLVYDLFFFIRL